MFEYFKFGEGIPDSLLLWLIVSLLVCAQVISLFNQLSLARKNRRFRKQIQEIRKHIQFLSMKSSHDGKPVP